MSDIVFHGFDNFDSPVQGDVTEEFESSKSDKRIALVKIIISVLAVIFLLEIFVYLFLKPSMGNVEIVWEGVVSYEESSLMNFIEPVKNRNLLSFKPAEAKALLSAVPGIENVVIEKRFPNTVCIKVTERTPVAMTFVSLEGRTVPVMIDRNGVLFMNSRSKSLASSAIPLISGIPVENIPEGMRIPTKYRDLMGQIAFIQSLSQPYFSAISEIHVVPKNSGNYELTLYPVHSRTKVLTGRQLTEDDLQYMMVALDAVNTLEPDVEVIDLRYGSIAYRVRGDSGESVER
ncbi:MAG: FtsQ-type POTRA domain-containing protein [Treponema sp.]|nr:FtsQ-type POTRA domain-containing protein [Treponema sp.]